VGIGNDNTWCWALVYGGTCGSVLNFQWLWWLVMEKLVCGGTSWYVWVHMGVDGYLGVCVGWE
jgi:hypothetical protein